jgi:ATP synthase protein I
MDEEERKAARKKPPSSGGDAYQAMRNAGIGLTIPMLLASSIIVSCVIGYYLDRWLGTAPWLFLLFFILGIATGIRETILLIRKMNDEKK